MSKQNGRNNQRRRNQRQPVDIWRTAAPLPDLDPIRVAQDVTALVRSLGEPPMHGGIEAGYHFGAIVERSAAIATALAFSADILADADT